LSGFTLRGRNYVGGELDGQLLEDLIEVIIKSVTVEDVGHVG
jgi:hypothetical protein